MASVFQATIEAHVRALTGLPSLESDLLVAASLVERSLRAGKVVLTCGNGGSAADAQHIVAEIVGRFLLERIAWPALDLGSNTPLVTAVSNDYGYAEVFARQVDGYAAQAGCLIAISTSGNSENVRRAVARARAHGIPVIGMTGDSGGKLREECDVCLRAPTSETPRIQEMHLILVHALCEIVEANLVKADAAE